MRALRDELRNIGQDLRAMRDRIAIRLNWPWLPIGYLSAHVPYFWRSSVIRKMEARVERERRRRAMSETTTPER